jgi:hypothetical protein
MLAPVIRHQAPRTGQQMILIRFLVDRGELVSADFEGRQANGSHALDQ